MRISPYNRLAQILVLDPANIWAFQYECEVDVPRVIVSTEERIPKLHTGASNVLISPFQIDSELQFDKLGIEAIMMAHGVFGTTIRYLEQIGDEYHSQGLDILPNAILMSSFENIHNKQAACKFISGYGIKLQFWDEIPKGTAYVLPDPEFLGVIAERLMGGNDCWYGIGIINTKPVLKVDLTQGK